MRFSYLVLIPELYDLQSPGYFDQSLDNVFIPKSLDKQCTKNKAINNDIDEWIDRAETMA